MYHYNNYRSGVRAYEFGGDFIIIEFKTGRKYLYTYASASETDIENMKILALQDSGLNSYINKYRPGYADKSSPTYPNYPYPV